LPNAQLTPVTSTAEAVKSLKAGSGIAAIAGKLAGRIYGVPSQAEAFRIEKIMSPDFWSLLVNHYPSGKKLSIEQVWFCLLPIKLEP
jgi:hypothetical protein